MKVQFAQKAILVYRPDGHVNECRLFGPVWPVWLLFGCPSEMARIAATGIEPERASHSGRPATRRRILTAASSIAYEIGITHLSLDAVAERALVSKGGLLYHFPTKQALLVALVEDQIATSERAIERARTRFGGNKPVHALVAALRDELQDKAEPPSGMIAALAESPALLEPIRQQCRQTAALLQTSANPVAALIAFYAIEGVRIMHLFQTDPLDRTQREKVLKALAKLGDLSGEEEVKSA